ncbi:carboxypeptidase regulatory-like domain-containing protein, partial [Candidatus Dojkabacteria bacterium]|nr:carboxypeptidase regulatory-like domain-containing protein [Candidatus Dojkabacteria bacterium]
LLSFLFMIRKVFTKRVKYGVVRDIDSNPVEGVVVGLRDMEFEKLILKRVTDSHGRYRILAPRGRYRIEVLETGYKVESIEGDSEVVIEKREDWVKRDITVSKIERE